MGDKTTWDTVQEEFYAPYYKSELPFADIDALVIYSMIDEIVRLRDILTALREPSEAVVESMLEKWGLIDALRAAVAAAEQEVDHG